MDVCEILNEVYISILVDNENNFKNVEKDEKVIREKLSFIPSLVKRLVKAGMERETIIFIVKETVLSSMEALPDKVEIKFEQVKDYTTSDITNVNFKDLYPNTIRDRTEDDVEREFLCGIFNARYAEIFRETVNSCLDKYCENCDINNQYHLLALIQESPDVCNTFSLMRLKCLATFRGSKLNLIKPTDSIIHKNDIIIKFIQDYNTKTKFNQEILSLIKLLDMNDKSRTKAKNDSRKGA